MRLDQYVHQQFPDVSRSEIQRWIKDGHVLVNGRPQKKPSYAVRDDDDMRVARKKSQPAALRPIPFSLDILYEDDDILVLNKPAGISVHPPKIDNATVTLVHMLLAHTKGKLSTLGGPIRPGIVHRLDKGTSGVMVVAKTDEVHKNLVQQFSERRVKKTYLALVHGCITPDRGCIEAPIGRSMRDRKKMAIFSKRGKAAKTEYRAKKYYKDYSLLEVSPLTGRTHQIRVHLATLGHSVVGDKTYGSTKRPAERMMLHAWKLAFTHPKTGKRIAFETPVPDGFTAVPGRNAYRLG